MGKWIKIKDRRPPEGEYVFLYGYFGRDIQFEGTTSYHNQIVVGCWENDDPNYPYWCYIPAHHCDVPQKVTHWRPLFKPPKE